MEKGMLSELMSLLDVFLIRFEGENRVSYRELQRWIRERKREVVDRGWQVSDIYLTFEEDHITLALYGHKTYEDIQEEIEEMVK